MVRLRSKAWLAGLPLLAAAAGAAAAPDLAVRRDGFERAGDTLRVVVENLGDAASPATELELSDRPFSGGPTGTSSHYRPVPGMQAVWIDQEPAGEDVVRLRIAFGRGLDPAAAAGELRFRGIRDVRVEQAPPGVTVDSGEMPRVEWGFPLPPAGAEIVLALERAPGETPRARIALPPSGKLPPPVYTSEGRTRSSVVELTLDCLDRPAAHRARVPVPALAPGESVPLAAAFAGGARGEVSAWIDPDDHVPEIREGNNIATRGDDSARWSLSALHIHSCFSEGPGSFDWQAWHAARSGYDLVWWSEHDWRVACRDHLTHIGFEPDEPIDVKLDASGRGARAELGSLEVTAGTNAVVLTTEPAGGTCRARVESDRKRLTYTLASDVDVTISIFAKRLQAGDVLTVGFDLSYHPAGARSLIYRLRREGTGGAAIGEDAGTPWSPEIHRTLPTGSWVRVRFPISRDAAERWPNGLDDNLIGLWFELDAEGEAAACLDDVEVEHVRCGMDLIAVEEEWTRFYPNLAHQVGGEISYLAPHLIRFGGDPALLLYDLERDRGDLTDTEEAAEVVRVVHARGGLVSWAHPLGANRIGSRDPDDLVAAIGDSLGGADALEVGYRNRGGASLEEHLALLDSLSANGLVVTALGVNDSHHNQWSPSENNFGTWLQSPADDEPSLLRAIAGGRAFFGDPVLFRGRLELQVGGVPMGGIVTGEGPRTARIRFAEIGTDRRVRLVADGTAVQEWTGITGSGALSWEMPPGAAKTLRAEVRAADGRPLAFTNPVFLDPSGTLRRRGE